jgi:two-component system, OmpR family, sensor kinase
VTLRARLGAWAAAFAAVVVVVFGGLVHLTYQRQLEGQLVRVLRQDLERVALLLDRPSLGASFAGGDAGGVALQFLDAGGRVVLGWGDPVPLPAVDRPTRVVRGERVYLVAQAPWTATRGTIRLAHDVTAALAAVDAVARLLVAIGAVVVLLAALLALIGVRRMLRPLSDLAVQTRRVDPAHPADVTYRGPRDEVHDVAAGLNEALGAIRGRQERERAFLLEVAHELAAPLTLVHYHLDGLRERDAGDPHLRAAADAARELLRTSQDLLAVARGELDRSLEPRVLDLREVVARVAAEYPGVAVAAGGAAEVAGDPERLVQVVRNLVRNAVQASGGVGGVRVALRSEGGTQVLEVADAGPGMSDETRARAFERGFSGGHGVGVGLVVARSLAEHHGGALRVASSSAAGTVMELRLPSLAARLAPAPPAGAAP